MDNLFLVLFLVSSCSLGFSGFKAIKSLFVKTKQKGNNKRLAISSSLALVISVVGFGLTAPPATSEVESTSTSVTMESSTVDTQAEIDQITKAEKEQEQITTALAEEREKLVNLEYEDTQTIEVNNNVPLFSAMDLSLDNNSWERYGDLDKLNRATSAEAMLNQDLMPTEKRGDISNVEPTGWQNKKLGNGYLYNRSHLIGFALSGENDNWKNLITGTAQLNNPEMLRHEMDIKYYLEQDKDNYVRYSVTPLFRGDELLARGVHLMAQSINDNEIQFNVYIFNVQDGAKLNYADGSSETDEEIAAAKKAAEEKAEQERIEAEKAAALEKEKQEQIAAEKAETERIAAEQAEAERVAAEQAEATQANPYVDANGNGLIKGSNNGIYHVPGSTYYDRTTNPAAWFSSIEEAENAGYRAPKR